MSAVAIEHHSFLVARPQRAVGGLNSRNVPSSTRRSNLKMRRACFARASRLTFFRHPAWHGADCELQYRRLRKGSVESTAKSAVKGRTRGVEMKKLMIGAVLTLALTLA